MASNIEFGQCLKYLLDIVDISGSRLARIITVDPSLINKWINGSRVPPYNTLYIDSISDYISKNIINSYQNKRINEFLEMFDLKSKIDEKADMTFKIKLALQEAQGYSLEKRRVKKRKKEKFGSVKGNIKPLAEICNCTPLTTNDSIIFGTENIFNAALDLLNKALTIKPGSEPILIANNNEFYHKPSFNSFYADWEKLMIKVLSHGWMVLSLLHLDDNIKKTQDLINEVFSFLGYGKYLPFYIYKSTPMALGCEFLIVPNVGAIVFLCSKSNQNLDYAFYFSTNEAIKALSSSFYQLKSNYSDMIQYYKKKDIIKLQKFMTSLEKTPGNRYTFINGFGIYYLSMLTSLGYLKAQSFTSSQRVLFDSLRKKQLECFIFNLKHSKYKLILSKDTIENMLLKGNNTEYVIECFKDIIKIYRSSNNFDIALVNEPFLKKSSNILNSATYFFLKERDSISIIINQNDRVGHNATSFKAMLLKEPTLVYSFEKHFINVWNSIPAVNKSKKEILSWLRKMLALTQDL